jgi:hypothetical protein
MSAKKFTLEVSIEVNETKGDVRIKGTAVGVYENGMRGKFTSGDRVDAAAIRGGASVSAVAEQVAANLAKLAYRSLP